MPGNMDTSYLTTQVTTIIGQLHAIFDEIGVPRNERESRETELFSALSETLHNHLRQVNSEKNEMTDEAQNIIKTIKQMEASLDDEKDRGYNVDTKGLRVTYPLTECLRDLKEKYNTISRLHRERFEQVKKLVEALESYSSHLEGSFVKLRLPPTNTSHCPPNFDLSPSFVTKLDEEFTRVYDEYNKRMNIVQTTAEEVVRLWSELGIPQAQTDSAIVQNYRDSPEQLGLHQSDIERLSSRRSKLMEEKKMREKRLSEMRTTIKGLWDRLGVEEPDRKAFLAANRGVGLRTINEFEDELARLNELKRQNLHLFVEDARVRLQELWDSLYFSEEEMLEFTPAFSDVYSDALLSAHEAEIERLLTLKDQRAPILAVIERHKTLVAERETLAASANDASRLLLKPQKGEKRDPGKLLREEKMRKRIAKELPKVTAELTKTLQKYENEYGRPFLVHGENYLDEIEAQEAIAPPARSKTPSALPPRAKTPSAPASTKKPATGSKQAPARPKTAMGGSTQRAAAKTPTGNRPAPSRNPPASVTSTTSSIPLKSPSKIPARVPLGNLKHGNNSPERKPAPTPSTNPVPQHNYAQDARTMGPPRAPPPKMRDVFAMHQEHAASVMGPPQTVPNRPASIISSSNSESSARFVRPTSPEDVYNDHERMSYMSASVVDRDRNYHHNLNFNSSMTRQAPPIVSRQTSNTSSNLTTGTTVSGSENWETYSEASELDTERDQRDAYYAKMHGAAGKRVAAGQPFGHMAPPPKMRMQTHIDAGEENLRYGSVTSDAAWSTELEETY